MERFYSHVTSTFARTSRDNRPIEDNDPALRLPLPVRIAVLVLILMALLGVAAVAACGVGQ